MKSLCLSLLSEALRQGVFFALCAPSYEPLHFGEGFGLPRNESESSPWMDQRLIGSFPPGSESEPGTEAGRLSGRPRSLELKYPLQKHASRRALHGLFSFLKLTNLSPRAKVTTSISPGSTRKLLYNLTPFRFTSATFAIFRSHGFPHLS